MYLYSINFGSTATTAETQLEFSTYDIFTGILQPASVQVGVNSPPFPDAVLRENLDTFRIDASHGALVVTLGTSPNQPLRAYQFFASFPALSAVGTYQFTSAQVFDFTTGDPAGETTGSLSIAKQLDLNEAPEPGTAIFAGFGLLLLVSVWLKKGSAKHDTNRRLTHELLPVDQKQELIQLESTRPAAPGRL